MSPIDDELSRRRFLQLMGASLAMAGLSGCRWPEKEILPYTSRPEGLAPGEPRDYATALEMAGIAVAVLAKSFDGRPVKIEGNPGHPQSLGAADLYAQASVLGLYDPDRSRSVVERQGSGRIVRSWDEFLAFARPHFAGLRGDRGAGLAILTEASSSLAFAQVRAMFQAAFPAATWCEYEPLSRDHEREGARAAFGAPWRAIPMLDKAEVIVDLDADLLGSHPAALRNARLFADGRRLEVKAGDEGHEIVRLDPSALRMNRLYVVEPTFTVTGTMADHRWPAPARCVLALTGRLAAELFLRQGLALPPGCEAVRPALEVYLKQPYQPAHVEALARDLLAHRGRGLIAVGPRQQPAAHALASLMNVALGNTGATVGWIPEPERPPHFEAIRDLAQALDAGRVGTLLVLGGNPVYDGPADLDLPARLRQAKTAIRLGLHEDETSALCRWHLPRAHALEAWGEALAWDGTLTLAQPLIEPLYDGWTAAQVLSSLVEEAPLEPYDLQRRALRSRFGMGETGGDAEFEPRWRAAVEAGFVADSAPTPAAPPLDGAALAKLLGTIEQTDMDAPVGANMELVFARDARLFDGRFANNAWLQELADPITRQAWGNAAILGPETAQALGVGRGDVVRLEYRGFYLEIPALIVPGTAPWSVTVALGGGRTSAGAVGDGVGANAYRLRFRQDPHHGSGLAIHPAGRREELALVQGAHTIDLIGLREQGRRVHELIREATVARFAAEPAFAREGEPAPPQLWKAFDYTKGERWGMAVDLNACSGCGACVLACVAENNTPVVGREQVIRGRIMHWLRVDRYFDGPDAEPRSVHEPLACVHCENAPCESVCPVGATVHDSEGLNVMVYNRCVGTRYCSNNCPYKVRRFNFFNYHKHETDLSKMVRNPDVTVRSRGVMEKCTYCVQRIQRARIRARNERRPLRDGEITPACAQTCPTGAIVFGDLNDPHSRVARLHADARAYLLLGELNVRPRTAHLARIHNPNPALGGPDESGAGA